MFLNSCVRVCVECGFAHTEDLRMSLLNPHHVNILDLGALERPGGRRTHTHTHWTTSHFLSLVLFSLICDESLCN